MGKPKIEDRESAQAIRRIKRVFKEISAGILETILYRLHDQFTAHDVRDDARTRRHIHGYGIRWLLEDVFELDGEVGVERQFQHIYFQICSRHIGGENFNWIYRTPAYEHIAGRPISDAELRIEAEALLYQRTYRWELMKWS